MSQAAEASLESETLLKADACHYRLPRMDRDLMHDPGMHVHPGVYIFDVEEETSGVSAGLPSLQASRQVICMMMHETISSTVK